MKPRDSAAGQGSVPDNQLRCFAGRPALPDAQTERRVARAVANQRGADRFEELKQKVPAGKK
jgi:hypothetical protein